MWKFLIDEDMPRSTAIILRQAGHMAEDVRDVGLRGRDDQEIFDYAQAQSAILITADKDFSNVLRFPLGTHSGIMVVRVPDELPTQKVNQELLRALADLAGEELTGLLVIVEAGRVRIRRPTGPSTAE
jgi:predicted nuclease of predicted toxin-antitoxin system